MKKITQKELAERFRIPRSMMSEILSGKRRPTRKLALELESISGVGRMIWLYADIQRLIDDIELSIGREINFEKGRPPGERNW